jgi:hypothetical protein
LFGVDRDRKTGALRALLAKPGPDHLIYAGPAFSRSTPGTGKPLKIIFGDTARSGPPSLT